MAVQGGIAMSPLFGQYIKPVSIKKIHQSVHSASRFFIAFMKFWTFDHFYEPHCCIASWLETNSYFLNRSICSRNSFFLVLPQPARRSMPTALFVYSYTYFNTPSQLPASVRWNLRKVWVSMWQRLLSLLTVL